MEKPELVSKIRELGFIFWEADRVEYVNDVFKEVFGSHLARVDSEEHTVRQLRKVLLKLKLDYKKWYLNHQGAKLIFRTHGFGISTESRA